MLKKYLAEPVRIRNMFPPEISCLNLNTHYLELTLASCVSTVFIGVSDNHFVLGANHIRLATEFSPIAPQINNLLAELHYCKKLSCLGIFGGGSIIKELMDQVNNTSDPVFARIGEKNSREAQDYLQKLNYRPYLDLAETTGYRASFSFRLEHRHLLRLTIIPMVANQYGQTYTLPLIDLHKLDFKTK